MGALEFAIGPNQGKAIALTKFRMHYQTDVEHRKDVGRCLAERIAYYSKQPYEAPFV